ncbi:AraC family transcriptional regulator [Paenibacillus sp. HN-1]|uniref:AraC family transcriptional regulator n=1 Tax=Paenibacillus TaxID=44249 RepID=UPI001CA7F2C0|nr:MULTISPECIES: helix-turn-helix domain-containing protein [Paenibacillus]MBY9077105.1 AraC family transcriptional regulator [Paenibacillus sp. CGMCC 1.18879]MBY9083403.1 AraC family transcriptional regulator [Paenibacillus sinensis]
MKKWNSAFANLAISYISIVLVLVLLLCSVFYIYFSGRYKEELRNKNQLILENTARTIETAVLQRAQQIYLDISLNTTADLRLFADTSFQKNLSKVIDLEALLKSEAASNSDTVQAVHLYDPEQNVMLSSLYGLKYGASHGDGAAFLADWMDGMRSNKSSSLWTRARVVPEDIFSSLPGGGSNALFTYAHTYPFQSSGDNSDLIIAVDVKVSAISKIIRNMMPSQYATTFISDPSGRMIVGSGEGLDSQGHYDSSITKALTSQEEAGSFNDSIEGTSYVISYRTLPSTGWKIFSAMPASFFYEQSIMVQKLILGITLFALLLGLVLSGILAKMNYNPIKRLAGKIKNATGEPTGQIINEYKLIDTAFIRLNDKVSSLEETLQASSPMIKRSALLNLLQNGYSREEWAEELPFLGISGTYSHYCCLLVNSREALTGLSSGDMQTVVSRIVEQLGAVCPTGSRMIAEELPDKRIIGILCASGESDALIEEISRFVLAEGKKQFGLKLQLSRGSWVQEMTDIHTSYFEAQTLMKYAYFLPEHSVLQDLNLLERENSPDEIPQSILIKFKEKLHARQLQEVIAAVEQLVTVMREGRYSADYCHFILANIVFIYSDYLKSVRYKPSVHGHSDLYNQYIEIRNIVSFRDWLADSVTTFIAQTEKRNSDRALSTIESAKMYIESHLSEDLSLEAVSAKVFISSKYLSRLFKEELGVTYTDYVTGRRMERAKTLIESNKMTIEQIAGTVGYGTAAYFIKKFKEMYGCTPGNYLRSMAKQL